MYYAEETTYNVDNASPKDLYVHMEVQLTDGAPIVEKIVLLNQCECTNP